MINLSGYERKFYHHSKRFPTLKLPEENLIDEVVFGLYPPDNSFDPEDYPYEMTMTWHDAKKIHSSKPTAELRVFEDAFVALEQFADVITWLRTYNRQLIQPEEFCALLLEHGFTEHK